MYVTKGIQGIAVISGKPLNDSSKEIETIPEGTGRLMFDGETLYREPEYTIPDPPKDPIISALTD